MIENIEIHNFRILQNFRMDGLRRVNLISGRNNVGKSTVLEASFLFMGHNSPDSFMNLTLFRGIAGTSNSSLWEPLFYNMDTNNKIRIVINDENRMYLQYEKDSSYLPETSAGISDEMLAQFRNFTKSTYSLKYHFEDNDYKEDGHFSLNGASVLRDIRTSLPGNEQKGLKPTRYINAAIARYNNNLLNDAGTLEINGQKDIIVDILKSLDTSIEDLVTLSVQGITQLYIRVNGHLMPLQYAGDGVLKLLNICMAILTTRNGLVLIDEIETGLHYSFYGKLWNSIEKISKYANCQVIATTHSYEMISSVKNNITDPDDFAYFRLGKEDGMTKAYHYPYQMLVKAIDADMEVR